jgi:transcriptional regulator with PAS, ATPase and Fis domain
MDAIREVAATDAKVLITGETGSGKEVAARGLHRCSQRSQAPLITIHCGGLPDSLLESELFGHQRGSFTGAYRDKPGLLEVGHNGTVFLDEVGEMSLRMQTLLLRFLDSGEIHRVGGNSASSRANVRLISATNRQLFDELPTGAFRKDLYYRLNVVHIRVPPLRDRREDVPTLVAHFANEFAHYYGMSAPVFPLPVLERLVGHDWPGNIRELRNLIERLVVRAQSHALSVADLEFEQPAPMRMTVAASETTHVAASAFERITVGRESFWDVVYGPFMARDLTREAVRDVVRLGLGQSRGNYRVLVRLLNMTPADYKRFMSFLRKHDCHLPFRPFRAEVKGPFVAGRSSAAEGAAEGEWDGDDDVRRVS